MVYFNQKFIIIHRRKIKLNIEANIYSRYAEAGLGLIQFDKTILGIY